MDEGAAEAAVAIGDGVDGLDLGVGDRRLWDQGQVVDCGANAFVTGWDERRLVRGGRGTQLQRWDKTRCRHQVRVIENRTDRVRRFHLRGAPSDGFGSDVAIQILPAQRASSSYATHIPANPAGGSGLKDALEARGLSVWFDEIRIKVGQSIRQEIEKGIANARFCVVVISPDFFRKQWTRAELDALFSRKMESGQNLILPVWHHVSKDEVLAQSPLLAGILALNSALMTVDEMAQAILEVVRG